MAVVKRSWFLKEGLNKAKLRLDIFNFSTMLGNMGKGGFEDSNSFEVGRSRFCLRISRKGVESYPRGHFGAFLVNESEHDVVVDFMISVEGGQSCHENYRMIEKKSDWGWNNLMMVRGVGAKIAIVVEVELKWENISGGLTEQTRGERSNETNAQQKLEEKLELKLGQNLEQMKTFVRAEIAKVKAPGIPDCPVCFEKFLPPKRIVQCLTAGVYIHKDVTSFSYSAKFR